MMNKEIWRPVVGYEGLYEVSNMGNVKSLHGKAKKDRLNGKILKLVSDSDGYHVVSLYLYGKAKTEKVHRLVAMAFIENPDNKPTVNHRNGIKNDNRLDNLEWSTHVEQSQHSWDTGLQVKTDKGREASRNHVNSIRHLRQKLILNTVTGIYYDSIKEATESISNVSKSYLNNKLTGHSINNTDFVYA